MDQESIPVFSDNATPKLGGLASLIVEKAQEGFDWS